MGMQYLITYIEKRMKELPGEATQLHPSCKYAHLAGAYESLLEQCIIEMKKEIELEKEILPFS